MIKALLILLSLATLASAQQPTTRPDHRPRVRYQELVAMLGPIQPDEPKDLQRCVDLVRMRLGGDPRVFPFEVQVSRRDDRVVLEGYTLFRQQLQPVYEILSAAGAGNVDSRVFSSAITDQPQFAVVTAEHARISSRPEPRGEQVTQLSAGDPVFLLQQKEQYFRCLGPDGYAGFIAAGDIRRIDGAELTRMLNAAAPPAERIDAVINKAKSLLGTEYVWGGTSPAGIDCSGLVQASFKSIGVNLPRDADQQALVGKLVATRWHRDALRAGDLLFFIGRRGNVSHVAIYLEGDQFIEAADQSVRISSLNPDHPNYQERREYSFCFGKRVIE